MHVAVRPFVTTGVALVGASVIAVAPVAPPLPDVKVPAVASTSAVQLSASWQELIENTSASIQALVDFYAEAPFPIVEQIIANQTANFETLVEALGETADGLITALTEQVPERLQAAFEALAEGNMVDFVNGLVLTALVPFLPVLELFGAVQPMFIDTLERLVGIAEVLTNPGNVLVYLVGPAGPLLNVIGASAVAVQNIIDSVDGGNLPEALINAPATVLDGFLNGGYGPNLIDLLFPGLPVNLTAGGVFSLLNLEAPPFSLPGPLATLVLVQRGIAGALGWMPPTAAATADAAATAAAVDDSAGADLTTAKVTDTSLGDGQIVNVNLDPAPPAAGATGATDEDAESGEEEGAVDSGVSGAEDADEGDAEDADDVEDADEEGSTVNGGTDLTDGNLATSPSADDDSSYTSIADKIRDGLKRHVGNDATSSDSGDVSDTDSASGDADNDSGGGDE